MGLQKVQCVRFLSQPLSTVLSFLGNLHLRLQSSGCAIASNFRWVVMQSRSGHLWFLRLVKLLCVESGGLHQIQHHLSTQPSPEPSGSLPTLGLQSGGFKMGYLYCNGRKGLRSSKPQYLQQ